MGLQPDDLPPLTSPLAAEQWLEAIGRAVSTGKLGHQQARAATHAVEAWLRARAEGATTDRLKELEEQLAKFKKGGGLRAVR